MIELVAAFLLTFAISKIIDKLYKNFSAELSFPAEIQSRSRFRKIILFAGIFLSERFFLELPEPQNFYSTAAAIFLLVVTVTDFEQQIIFDKILLPFALLGIFATVQLNLPLTNHLLASAVGGGLFLLVAVLTNGIGGGDVKFIACLGLWFGTEKLFWIVICGMIFAGMVALILILLGKAGRKDCFAYAPYFALTAVYFLID